jgi:hypothetical protein
VKPRTSRLPNGLTILVAAGLAATGCGQAPPPYKPVADVKQL